ncbi:MAG: mannonate dehydratase [Armatimonadetes bacterium]|nr:mannonate dehydratase [Armatimonadota bacterium]
MHIGLGLYPGILNDDHLKFARQIGVTHIVAWMPLPAGNGVWEFQDLLRLRCYIESFGLKLAALENLPPTHWDKVLLSEPGRDRQIENVQTTLRNMGKAGIGCLGYYFSIVGVWGHWRAGQSGGGRGGAGLTSFDYDLVKDAPLAPRGEAWCGYRVEDNPPPGTLGRIDIETMWDRYRYFLEHVVPVAEEAGVRLAEHPDDPPVPELRGIARLFISPEAFLKATQIAPSFYNGIEFCQGTFAEMGIDVLEAIRTFGFQKKICYVHFRNVKGAVPQFDEVFIDEGDVNMLEAMKAYREVGFDGVLIPDHSPALTAPGSWHAGMAYAVGYMRAVFQMLGISG